MRSLRPDLKGRKRNRITFFGVVRVVRVGANISELLDNINKYFQFDYIFCSAAFIIPPRLYVYLEISRVMFFIFISMVVFSLYRHIHFCFIMPEQILKPFFSFFYVFLLSFIFTGYQQKLCFQHIFFFLFFCQQL